jgi:hypothetical protein
MCLLKFAEIGPADRRSGAENTLKCLKLNIAITERMNVLI